VAEGHAAGASGLKETLAFEHTPHILKGGTDETAGEGNVAKACDVREFLAAFLE
jgi:hypothetical protein